MDNIKENKSVKLQIRISPSEKQILAELRQSNSEFNVSRLFREALNKEYAVIKEKKIKEAEEAKAKEVSEPQGIGQLTIA